MQNLIKENPPIGWVVWSFTMLDHNEKIKLVIELIGAGVTDASIIIANIKEIEEGLFKHCSPAKHP